MTTTMMIQRMVTQLSPPFEVEGVIPRMQGFQTAR
jgi:hypothetical protein